jgi:dTDP-4-dehydrorhamnose 3,5-epimerase-like enzyme
MEPTIIELASGTDERGFSIKPFEGKQLDAVFNIHLVSLNPGTTRGNHFHPTQTEYIFVLGKQGKLVTVDSANDKRSETFINGEKCPRIVVPPQVAHAIKNTGSEQMYLLCYTDSPLIPERDVIKKVILK